MARRTKKESGDSTAVERAMPGEKVVDAKLIDRAVEELNRLYVAKGLETYTAVGQYLVDNFFGGDDLAPEGRGAGHLSYRALEERDDLVLSKSVLHRSVQVLRLHNQLGKPEWQRVTATHYREVLALTDFKQQAKLLKEAEEEGLSSRELAEKAKALKPTETRGRRPFPGFVKGLKQVQRALGLIAGQKVTVKDFDYFTEDEATSLLRDVERQLGEFQKLKQKVEAAIAKKSKASPGR